LVPIAGIAFNLITIRTSKMVHLEAITAAGSLSAWTGNNITPIALQVMGDSGSVRDTNRGPVQIFVSRDTVRETHSSQLAGSGISGIKDEGGERGPVIKISIP
ncbi:hypothetical protein DXG01_011817, partial [Tephrocybe rancida]